MTLPPVRVFVSSTTQDMLINCRPIAIDVIDSYHPHAFAEAMEKWNVDQHSAVELCKQKLQISSHYLGIFAYRRGWVPDNLEGRSMTEAEYDWAIEYGLLRRIFVPKPDSSIACRLRIAASGESSEATKAQAQFRSRVQKMGACVFFESIDDMEEKIRDAVQQWIWTDGKTLIDKVDEIHQSLPQRKPPMSHSQLLQLGRFGHVLQFLLALEIMKRRNNYPAICFLIHGADGFGHEQLLEGMLAEIPEQHQTAHISCSPFKDGHHANGLFRQIEEWITEDSIYKSVSPKSLAEILKEKKLRFQDVVIQVHDVHRFEGGLSAFTETFWRPLVQVFGKPSEHRLFVFVIMRGEISDEKAPYLHNIMDKFGELDINKIISFPPLRAFTEEDIQGWLAEIFPDMDIKQIIAEAKDIFVDSQGIPDRVYRRLQSLIQVS